MQRQFFWLLLALVGIANLSASAATISFNPTIEDPNFFYITNFIGADLDSDNVGDGDDNFTYVAPDRPAQGQTFLTGGAPEVLTAVWVQHGGYDVTNTGTTWYQMTADSTITVRITDPAATGTNDFVIYSDVVTLTGNEENALPSTLTSNAEGSGLWVRVALDIPVLLEADTLYGFDLGSSSGTFFETSGIKDSAEGGNPYADGSAYTTGGGGVGDNTMAIAAGDRKFLIETGIYLVGATSPTPVDNAIDVSYEEMVTFSWTAGQTNDTPDSSIITNPDIMYHHLYISAANDTDLSAVTPIVIDADIDPADGVVDAAASYQLDYLLQSDAVYTWRVDEVLDNGSGSPYPAGDPNNLIGKLWSFETEKQQAQLDSMYPLDNAVEAGDEIVLTVSAINPITDDNTGMSYQWYKNDALVVGETGVEYTMTVTEDDENAVIYCKVKVVESGTVVQSRSASIVFKALVGYWPMDADVMDATGNGSDGTENGTITYAAAEFANGIEFDGTEDFIALPEGYANFNTGLTFALWVNPEAAGNFARFIDFGNGEYNNNVFFYRMGTSTDLAFNVMNGDVGSIIQAPALELNTWQFIAVTMDNTGNAVLYKNGSPLVAGKISIPNDVVRTGNFIGKSNWESDALYAGMMDDLRYYNYALSGTDIAEMFYQQRGEFCLEYPAFDITGIDGTPDCAVDVLDLAAIASEWLDCGMFPECP